jgi:hypothetical protein
MNAISNGYADEHAKKYSHNKKQNEVNILQAHPIN